MRFEVTGGDWKQSHCSFLFQSRLSFDNHRNIVLRAHFDLIKCKL